MKRLSFKYLMYFFILTAFSCTDKPAGLPADGIGRKFCSVNPVNIPRDFPSASSYRQVVDDFKFKRRDGDFFYLNHTSGYRYFYNEKFVTFGDGKIIVKTPPNAASEIYYGMKFDESALAKLHTSKILNEYITQSNQMSISRVILQAGGEGKLKLKLENKGVVKFEQEISVFNKNGIREHVVSLPTNFSEEINQIVVLIDAESDLELHEVSLEITPNNQEAKDSLTSSALFLVSSLLDAFDESKGMIFESGRAQRKNMGYGVPSTGMMALALIIGSDLKFIEFDVARRLFESIVNVGHPAIVARAYNGWLPHFIGLDPNSKSEFSVVDTAIYYDSLLFGLEYFKFYDKKKEIVDDIKKIQFKPLLSENRISLGYESDLKIIPYYYDVIGGEFILIELLRAIATGDTQKNLSIQHRKTWGEIGFIPEIANLFFFQFGSLSEPDAVYKHNWLGERKRLYERQRSIIPGVPYFGFSECEIIDKDEKRRYVQQGAELDKIRSLGGPDGFWFTPSYQFMTSLLDSSNFYSTYRPIQKYLSPLSSVPECIFYSTSSGKIDRYNFFQVPIRMHFSLFSIYHFLKQSCNDKDVIYELGTTILGQNRVLPLFYR
jgi:hypothetical protein